MGGEDPYDPLDPFNMWGAPSSNVSNTYSGAYANALFPPSGGAGKGGTGSGGTKSSGGGKGGGGTSGGGMKSSGGSGGTSGGGGMKSSGGSGGTSSGGTKSSGGSKGHTTSGGTKSSGESKGHTTSGGTKSSGGSKGHTTSGGTKSSGTGTGGTSNGNKRGTGSGSSTKSQLEHRWKGTKTVHSSCGWPHQEAGFKLTISEFHLSTGKFGGHGRWETPGAGISFTVHHGHISGDGHAKKSIKCELRYDGAPERTELFTGHLDGKHLKGKVVLKDPHACAGSAYALASYESFCAYIDLHHAHH